MNIEELEAIVDAMAEECGDQIDALYDTVTLQKDTYCGFICRLREVVRLAKNEQKKSAPVGNATTYAYDPAKTGKSELPDGSAYALESFKADKAKEPTTVGNAAAMRKTLEFADRELRMATEDGRYGDDLVYLVGCMRTVASACRAALALPRLNCEVGTVEEQAQRFNDYCHKQGNSCCIGRSKGACPMFRGYKVDCALVWSQTPYESEVKK